jgi:hypothetical protein
MKDKLTFSASLLLALFSALAPTAGASTTWHVNGANGSDYNNCLSTATACQTIGHAISLAVSGDSITIAPAVYSENLTINFSLRLIGSNARTTIIDGAQSRRVISILSTSAAVTLSNLTIRNGIAPAGGGILNWGNLTLSNSAITGNYALSESSANGGGIYNSGTLTVRNSTFSGNTTTANFVAGGAIYSSGPLVMYNSTVSGNSVGGRFGGGGGGIYTAGGATRISNTTIAGNSGNSGGGIYKGGGTVTIQNSIVSGNSPGRNCFGTMTSNGYNLSSDGTCTFHNGGDRNNTNPRLGTLGNYGGPTNTMQLLTGSPAIDTGNPSGCRDSQGNLLKTDQRGMPRPDKEDTVGCDMGAFERQSD